ncbi:aminotransferase class III-fold pyridoxal phosphate-dependent enzyme, partial [Rhizobium johnstonii]|uniref:aminotransferase class III-fold pyridoxal phosphate-dependent enzyme n=1 Tax=Rhizobium johnstonii TaxID=3019933 RepID=UPI003F9AB90D
MSALTGRATIMDAPPAGSIGGTYAGNPVACVAALASMDELERLQLADRAVEMGEVIEEILGPLCDLPHVAELRGRGAMRAL